VALGFKRGDFGLPCGFSASFQLTLTPRRDGSASWAALTGSFNLAISR